MAAPALEPPITAAVGIDLADAERSRGESSPFGPFSVWV